MVSLYLRCKSAAERNISVYAEFSLSLLRNDGQVRPIFNWLLHSFIIHHHTHSGGCFLRSFVFGVCCF